jgi:NAD+ kinase
MIGILYNPRVARARHLAEEIAVWIEQRGRQAQVFAAGHNESVDDLREADLLVTLGGDGSILRAARAVAPLGTPILGINMGRVGFLTEADPEMWRDVLARALVDDYWLEERIMLQAVACRNGEILGQAQALNDVVVGRGARARVVHLQTEVDGGRLATYVADGLIVATPTGSTAYALAAGGPVMPPQLRNVLLVPVAPHLSMARPIVLSEGVSVRIRVIDDRPAVLTVDGDIHAQLESGDEVIVEVSPHAARFARVQERTYFYKTLVERLVPRNHTPHHSP